jgi:TetR/AcrR family transcriptional regulator, repressor for uid operon
MARTKDDLLTEQRREQILLAAATIFKKKGFHAARTEEICAAAGLSPGTLFRHFKDKDAIIAAVAAEEVRDYVSGIEEMLSPSGIKFIQKLGTRELKLLVAPSKFELSTESWLELSRSPNLRSVLVEADLQVRNAFVACFKEAKRMKLVRADLDPPSAAAIMIALFTGLVAEAEFGSTFDTAQNAKLLARGLRDLLQHYLQPPASTTP